MEVFYIRSSINFDTFCFHEGRRLLKYEYMVTSPIALDICERILDGVVRIVVASCLLSPMKAKGPVSLQQRNSSLWVEIEISQVLRASFEISKPVMSLVQDLTGTRIHKDQSWRPQIGFEGFGIMFAMNCGVLSRCCVMTGSVVTTGFVRGIVCSHVRDVVVENLVSNLHHLQQASRQ